MSLCVVDGKACRCQPEEGYPCPGVIELRARIAALEKPPMIPILWNHDHHPKSIIGSLAMDGNRLIATLIDPMLKEVFDHVFPGAGYQLLEYEERASGKVFIKRAEIVEFSLTPWPPA